MYIVFRAENYALFYCSVFDVDVKKQRITDCKRGFHSREKYRTQSTRNKKYDYSRKHEKNISTKVIIFFRFFFFYDKFLFAILCKWFYICAVIVNR
jgi:hypothetical protein